jgi:hypothetical protein
MTPAVSFLCVSLLCPCDLSSLFTFSGTKDKCHFPFPAPECSTNAGECLPFAYFLSSSSCTSYSSS